MTARAACSHSRSLCARPSLLAALSSTLAKVWLEMPAQQTGQRSCSRRTQARPIGVSTCASSVVALVHGRRVHVRQLRCQPLYTFCLRQVVRSCAAHMQCAPGFLALPHVGSPPKQPVSEAQHLPTDLVVRVGMARHTKAAYAEFSQHQAGHLQRTINARSEAMKKADSIPI